MGVLEEADAMIAKYPLPEQSPLAICPACSLPIDLEGLRWESVSYEDWLTNTPVEVFVANRGGNLTTIELCGIVHSLPSQCYELKRRMRGFVQVPKAGQIRGVHIEGEPVPAPMSKGKVLIDGKLAVGIDWESVAGLREVEL